MSPVLTSRAQMDTKKATWIDIQNPTLEDIAALREKFSLHEVIARELIVPSVRAHIEVYDQYLFFTYNFPLYNPIEQTSRRAEIDFVITKDTVITVHYESLLPLMELKDLLAESPFDLLYAILFAIFRFEERQLRHIGSKLEAVSDGLFKNREKETLEQISFLKRDVSEYRVIVRAGDGILKSLCDHGVQIWGPGARAYLNELAGEHYKIVSQIEDYRETLADFERTNSQLMYAKTTAVMKTLTAFSFLTFPFMLFAAVLSMPINGNPIIDYPGAFWFVVGVILTGIIALAIFFRRKDWL